MGNLATPQSVQKLQTALHAKAKAEADYRFYALYDKISRDDILAHAYAQCRSNKGAPGVDCQDFADIEAYGVERWLRNGVIDLTTGEFRQGRREDYITKQCGVAFDPNATCPKWEAFQKRSRAAIWSLSLISAGSRVCC